MTTLTAREAYQIWKRDFRRGRLLDDYTDFNARFRDMAYATGLMPLPPGWKLPRWAMSVGMVLGGRGAPGYVLGHGASGAPATWWTAGGATGIVAAYQPIGAASLAASYVNLANPGTYDAAPGVAPTWDAAGGWTGNGSTTYLTTGIFPAANWTIAIRISNATAKDYAVPVGQRDASTPPELFGRATQIYPNSATYNLLVRNGTLSGLQSAPGVSSGVIVVAGATLYVDGNARPGTIPANSGIANHALYILANNIYGTRADVFNGKIQAVAIYSATLSAATVAAVTAAMAAL